MTLADRIRSATRADLDRDLLEFLGRRPGQPVGIDRENDRLVVGDESAPMDEIRAVAEDLLRTPPVPARVTIDDLPGAE